MARAKKSIEDLLAEREQFELWLARLEESGAKAPDKVRDKVRDDYRHRLDAVIEELGSHADSIAEQLAEHRVSQADLTAQEEGAQEELAEAEVRHAVGEYDEAEWNKLKALSDDQLESIRSDLRTVTEEIDRLAEVQALIASPPAAPEPTPAADEAPPEPATDDQGGPGDDAGDESSGIIEIDSASHATPADTEVVPLGAPRFTPRGSDASEAPRTLRFPNDSPSGETNLDELDFLKSVTEDESAGPAVGRASGGFAAPEGQPGTAETAATTGQDGPGQPQEKTLKCTECGELNRPTEWYCERCGAELASL